MSYTDSNLFLPSETSFRVELGNIIFYINSWQISGQRIIAEESALSGRELVTGTSERFRRISLEGIWVTDEEPEGFILGLDDYIKNETSFSLTLRQMHFSECRLIKYTANERAGEPCISIKLEITALSSPAMNEEDVHV